MSALNAQIVSFIATEGPRTAREILDQFPQLEDTPAALRTLKQLVVERQLEQRTPEVGNLSFAVPAVTPAGAVAQDDDAPPRAPSTTTTKGGGKAADADRVREATLAFLANQPAGANAADMRGLFETLGVASNVGYKCLEPLIRDGRIKSKGKTRGLHLRLSSVVAGALPKAVPSSPKAPADDLQDVDRQLDQAERTLSDRLLRAALSSSDMDVRKLAFAIENIRSARSPLRPGAKPRATGVRKSAARKPRKEKRGARKKAAKRRPRTR